MKVFSLYFMAYSQGKFFGNMLAMNNKKWFERVIIMPSKLSEWMTVEVRDGLEQECIYRVYHEYPAKSCIQIIPNLDKIKILQKAKDNSNTSWKDFYKRDVENWNTVDTAIYTLHQNDLSDWTKTKQHIITCADIYNLYVDYKLAKEYFDVYWKTHSNLFRN